MDDFQVSLPAAMANGGDMKDLVQMIVLPSEAMQPSREDGGNSGMATAIPLRTTLRANQGATGEKFAISLGSPRPRYLV